MPISENMWPRTFWNYKGGLYAETHYSMIVGRYNYEKGKYMSQKIEEMASFFDARIEGYDDHMKSNCEYYEDFYEAVGACVPQDAKEVLILGCGTGADLGVLMKRCQDANFTCVDLSSEMLKAMTARFPEAPIQLIKGSYFQVGYNKKYDAVVAVMTMHHWTYEEKIELYRKIKDDLKPGGIYVEGDYYVGLERERELMKRRTMLLADSDPGQYYHIDIPYNQNTQRQLYALAGFSGMEVAFAFKGDEVHKVF